MSPAITRMSLFTRDTRPNTHRKGRKWHQPVTCRYRHNTAVTLDRLRQAHGKRPPAPEQMTGGRPVFNRPNLPVRQAQRGLLLRSMKQPQSGPKKRPTWVSAKGKLRTRHRGSGGLCAGRWAPDDKTMIAPTYSPMNSNCPIRSISFSYPPARPADTGQETVKLSDLALYSLFFPSA